MILYSQIRWFVFVGFVLLMAWGIVNAFRKKPYKWQAIGTLIYLIVWLIIYELSGLIIHDISHL